MPKRQERIGTRRIGTRRAGTLRIGTRGSALALAQAGMVRDQLAARGLSGELVVIKTTGDRITDRPLREVGGKGLFVKEIEEALLGGEVDLAVHSMKDLPALLPPGLAIGAVPRRADPRDVLVPRDRACRSLEDLPSGALVATGSLRRMAQLAVARPDLTFTGMRGNIDTRLGKVREGAENIEATLLAAAGIERLGLLVPEAIPLDVEVMIPAVGQGVLALELREGDEDLRAALEAAIHHEASAVCAAAERGFLEGLGGDCKTPIAGHAVLHSGRVVLRGLVAGPEGGPRYADRLEARPEDARDAGLRLAALLLARGAAAVLGVAARETAAPKDAALEDAGER